MSVSNRAADPRTTTSRLALAAAGGVVVYLVIDVALALLRPGLSPINRAESDYGVGPYSWLMDVNFLLRGALSLAPAAAILRLRPNTSNLEPHCAKLGVCRE